MKNIKKIYIIVGLVITGLFVAGSVLAVTNYGTGAVATEAGLTNSTTLPELIGRIIGSALSLVGVLFFVLMIYGGITWMIARGNEETSKKSLNTIFGAIIGIIIVIASYAITQFVFKSFSSNPEGVTTPADTTVSTTTPS